VGSQGAEELAHHHLSGRHRRGQQGLQAATAAFFGDRSHGEDGGEEQQHDPEEGSAAEEQGQGGSDRCPRVVEKGQDEPEDESVDEKEQRRQAGGQRREEQGTVQLPGQGGHRSHAPSSADGNWSIADADTSHSSNVSRVVNWTKTLSRVARSGRSSTRSQPSRAASRYAS